MTETELADLIVDKLAELHSHSGNRSQVAYRLLRQPHQYQSLIVSLIAPEITLEVDSHCK